jgi:hypothetical protein
MEPRLPRQPDRGHLDAFALLEGHELWTTRRSYGKTLGGSGRPDADLKFGNTGSAIGTTARRDGRADECTGLENRRAERLRGFESLSLRQMEFSALMSGAALTIWVTSKRRVAQIPAMIRKSQTEPCIRPRLIMYMYDNTYCIIEAIGAGAVAACRDRGRALPEVSPQGVRNLREAGRPRPGVLLEHPRGWQDTDGLHSRNRSRRLFSHGPVRRLQNRVGIDTRQSRHLET